MKYMIRVPHMTIGRAGQIVTAAETRMDEQQREKAVAAGLLLEIDDEPTVPVPVPDPLGAPVDDLTHLSRDELYQMAKDLEVPGRTNMTSAELADAVRAARAS